MKLFKSKVKSNNKPKNGKDPPQQNHEEGTEISAPSILTSITTTFQSTVSCYFC